MSESEKITCPYCGYDELNLDGYDPMRVVCPGCHENYHPKHARLAVQHARLVEAVDKCSLLSCSTLPPAGLLSRIGSVLDDVGEAWKDDLPGDDPRRLTPLATGEDG